MIANNNEAMMNNNNWLNKMNLKRSQQFLYFQHKARHYDNLRKMKPSVDSHQKTVFSRILQQTSRVPYFHRYDIEHQNEGLITRVSSIMRSDRAEVEKAGYSRYNQQFIPKSSFYIEKKKSSSSIEHDNQILATKMINAKPSIGTIHDWAAHSHKIEERKRNLCKLALKNSSRTIQVYSQAKFVPEHYQSFLNMSLNSKKSIKEAKQSPQQEAHLTLRIQKLYQLPRLKRMRGSVTKIADNGKKID